jgi:hypothetical protein
MVIEFRFRDLVIEVVRIGFVDFKIEGALLISWVCFILVLPILQACLASLQQALKRLVV